MSCNAIIIVNTHYIGIVIHNGFVLIIFVLRKLYLFYHFSGTRLDFVHALVRNVGNDGISDFSVSVAVGLDFHLEAEKI